MRNINLNPKDHYGTCVIDGFRQQLAYSNQFLDVSVDDLKANGFGNEITILGETFSITYTRDYSLTPDYGTAA